VLGKLSSAVLGFVLAKNNLVNNSILMRLKEWHINRMFCSPSGGPEELSGCLKTHAKTYQDPKKPLLKPVSGD